MVEIPWLSSGLRVQIQSLVGELRFHKPHGTIKKKKEKKRVRVNQKQTGLHKVHRLALRSG